MTFRIGNEIKIYVRYQDLTSPPNGCAAKPPSANGNNSYFPNRHSARKARYPLPVEAHSRRGPTQRPDFARAASWVCTARACKGMPPALIRSWLSQRFIYDSRSATARGALGKLDRSSSQSSKLMSCTATPRRMGSLHTALGLKRQSKNNAREKRDRQIAQIAFLTAPASALGLRTRMP